MLAPAARRIIEFTIPGEAVPWARAGGGKNVVRFTPKRQRNFMTDVKMLGAQALSGAPLLDGPIELSLLFIYAWPASWSAKRRAQPGANWKASRPDGGNLQKIVEDALNKVVWTDDARVASWHGWKQYGATPRVLVRITALDGPT